MKVPKTLNGRRSRYELADKLGEGGNGSVYRVTAEDGASYALKLLRPEANTEKRRRFLNEVQFCAELRHPSIIHVLDLSREDSDVLFCVMPLYERTLRAALQSGMTYEDRLAVFEHILDGVAAAHSLKVIHRDLKPENVLLGEKGEVVVADFGIAHFAEELLAQPVKTGATAKMGNFQYAAPEQRAQRTADLDQRADIFALGLMLHELFTGEVPHGTGSKRIASCGLEYEHLDALVTRMLMQNPAQRPSSVREVRSLRQELKRETDERREEKRWQRADKRLKEDAPQWAAQFFGRLLDELDESAPDATSVERGLRALALDLAQDLRRAAHVRTPLAGTIDLDSALLMVESSIVVLSSRANCLRLLQPWNERTAERLKGMVETLREIREGGDRSKTERLLRARGLLEEWCDLGSFAVGAVDPAPYFIETDHEWCVLSAASEALRYETLEGGVIVVPRLEAIEPTAKGTVELALRECQRSETATVEAGDGSGLNGLDFIVRAKERSFGVLVHEEIGAPLPESVEDLLRRTARAELNFACLSDGDHWFCYEVRAGEPLPVGATEFFERFVQENTKGGLPF